MPEPLTKPPPPTQDNNDNTFPTQDAPASMPAPRAQSMPNRHIVTNGITNGTMNGTLNGIGHETVSPTVISDAYTHANGNMNSHGKANGNGNGNGHKSSVITYDVVCVQEPGCGPLRFREAPARLVLWDLRFLFKHAWMLPYLFLPLEPLGLDVTPDTLAGQIVMITVSVFLTLILIFSVFLSAPLIPLVAIGIFCYICLALQGQGTRESDSGATIDVSTRTEAWFCVNGVSTTSTGAQLIANRIESLFNRRVTALINCSFGFWFDIVECILQRDLLLVTPDIRNGYEYIRNAVRDPRKKRVVIFGHSQGGIIVSAWVDQLLCDFPEEILSKVEIYTFASAANHFSRPTSKGLDFPFLRSTIATEPFGRVEHFANEGDFVAQFGVIGNSPTLPTDITPGGPIPILNGQFGGRIFVRKNHTGHLFNSHYLLPGDSILDDPAVRRNSKLMSYLGGKGVAK